MTCTNFSMDYYWISRSQRRKPVSVKNLLNVIISTVFKLNFQFNLQLISDSFGSIFVLLTTLCFYRSIQVSITKFLANLEKSTCYGN